MQRTAIKSPSGADLNMYWSAAAGAPKAVVQINHGLAEHAERYSAFMQVLSQAGFASVAHDHRGHGHTTAPKSKIGQFAEKNGVKAVLQDVAAVKEWAATTWPTVPQIVFGHSMGGLVALNYALAHPDDLSGLAVWNANAAPGFLGSVGHFILSLEALFSSKKKPSTIMPTLTFKAWDKATGEGPSGWLSHIKSEVQAYNDDPLCGFDASISMWFDVMKMAKAGESKALLAKLPHTLPTFILGGAEDPATNQGAACETLAQRLKDTGMTNVRCDILPKTRHESLNDTGATRVMAEFIAWADHNIVT